MQSVKRQRMTDVFHGVFWVFLYQPNAQQQQSTVVLHAGETKPLPLKAPLDASCPASIDSFTLTAPWLGALTHINLSHNGKGTNPDWLLEMVRIVHMQSKQEWLFFGHVWLHSGNRNQVTLTLGKLVQACKP